MHETSANHSMGSRKDRHTQFWRPERDFLNNDEYTRRAIPLAQAEYRKQVPTVGETVSHPRHLGKYYTLERVEGEIAFLSHSFGYDADENPEKETQFPLDELFRLSVLNSIAERLQYTDVDMKPRNLFERIRHIFSKRSRNA